MTFASWKGLDLLEGCGTYQLPLSSTRSLYLSLCILSLSLFPRLDSARTSLWTVLVQTILPQWNLHRIIMAKRCTYVGLHWPQQTQIQTCFFPIVFQWWNKGRANSARLIWSYMDIWCIYTNMWGVLQCKRDKSCWMGGNTEVVNTLLVPGMSEPTGRRGNEVTNGSLTVQIGRNVKDFCLEVDVWLVWKIMMLNEMEVWFVIDYIYNWDDSLMESENTDIVMEWNRPWN